MAAIIIPPFKLSSSTTIVPRTTGVTTWQGNAGGLTINGGTATSDSINIFPNNQAFADSNTGRITLNERVTLPESGSLVGTNIGFGNAFTDSLITASGTWTMNSALKFFAWAMVQDNRIIIPTSSQIITSASTFTCTTTIQPNVTIADIYAVWAGFYSSPLYSPSLASAVSTTPTAVIGYQSDPRAFIKAGSNAGATSVIPQMNCFSSSLAGTISGFIHVGLQTTATIYSGYRALNPVVSGTGSSITTLIGVDIEAQTSGTTNIGIRQAGTATNRLAGNTRIGDTTAPVVAADINGWINYSGAVRVSTQFDKTTNTTLADVTGLSVTVVAGRKYRFRATLFVDASAVGGQKYAISGTATATAIIYNINTISNTTNLLVITSRQTALAGSSGQAGATSNFTEIAGLISVNAGGTLTVQFAQNASNGTSSVLVGSYFEVWDIV